jgi:nitrite reductase/ring-hydroxylating ferredoxin subunit
LLDEQMLRKEQNEFITRTGPSTPMGQLFRCCWTPALLSEELPQNDCPPVRVKLLSERLVAFRDSQGRYGLIDEFCAHRGASRWFGRNEECGLRCPYHGWKFDVTGQCLEVPSDLGANHLAALVDRLTTTFDFTSLQEHAIELDPRRLDAALVSTLARIGVTRASLGV